jgi:hypothetical protein
LVSPLFDLSAKEMKSRPFTDSIFFPIIASLLVGFLAVSSKSLWIDEGLSAAKVMAPTLYDAWQRLIDERSTNMHMLLYMACLWGWEKLCGHSEFALRSMNVPFFTMGMVALWLAVPREIRIALVGVICLSPFMWFYLDDARTYCMLFGFSAIATALLMDWQQKRTNQVYPLQKWSLALAFSLACLAWTHIVGMIFQIGVVFFIFYTAGVSGTFRLLSKYFPSAFLLATSNFVLLAYYSWTKSIGVEPNAIGKTSLINFLYGIYEFLGFAGFGPNRNELRIDPATSILENALPLLLLGCLWCALLVLFFQKKSKTKAGLLFQLVLCLFIIPIMILYFLGVFQGIRALPRYAIISFPAFAVVTAIFALEVWRSKTSGKIVVVSLAVLLGISSINLRWSPRHEKDNYREASAIAVKKIKLNKTILWGADQDTGWYYGIDFKATHPDTGNPLVHIWSNPNLDTKNFPEIIFLSKKDVYDGSGKISSLAAELGYQQSPGPFAFLILEKSENFHP